MLQLLRHLIPKQAAEHGLEKDQLNINPKALEEIITKYTRESGVRGLEKKIAKIARVTAKKIALGEELPKCVTKDDLKEYLGLPISAHDIQKGNEIATKAYDRPMTTSVAQARDIIGVVITTAIEGGDVQAAADKANAEFQVVLDEDLAARNAS